MDCSPPDSSVHGILQLRILEYLPFPSPGNPSDPGIEPESPVLQAGSLPTEPPGKTERSGKDMLTVLQCIGQHKCYPDQKLHITKVDHVQKSPLLLDNWTYVTKTSIFGVSRPGVQFWLKAWPWEFKLCWENPLEEGMATHSSSLAWRIPMDRGVQLAMVHWVVKSWTCQSDSAQHSTCLSLIAYHLEIIILTLHIVLKMKWENICKVISIIPGIHWWSNILAEKMMNFG